MTTYYFVTGLTIFIGIIVIAGFVKLYFYDSKIDEHSAFEN